MTTKAFSETEVTLEGCHISTNIRVEDSLITGEALAASEPWKNLQFSAAALSQYLTREDAALHRYTVTIENKVAGVICIRHPWLRGPYIELLGLFPEFRNRGIGRQLLAWAESEARRESKNLWVLVSSFNLQALSFYERFGFYRIGPIHGLVSAEYDEILLRKKLE